MRAIFKIAIGRIWLKTAPVQRARVIYGISAGPPLAFTRILAKIGQKSGGRHFPPPISCVKKRSLTDVPFLGEVSAVHVTVRDNNVDQALKALKKKLQREGVFREMKLRRSYEKPSERKAREKAEAVRRGRKMERKRLEREGF